MDVFLKNGKGMLLAYDQGFEHGPSADFNERNIDPSFILDILQRQGPIDCQTQRQVQLGQRRTHIDTSMQCRNGG